MPEAKPKSLKNYLDLARAEPIQIQRSSGDTYILMPEKTYAEMQIEISSLQSRLLGMIQVLAGKVTEYTPSKKDHAQR